MKIFIPTNDKTIEGNVGDSFGRSEYYFVYDTETKESAFLENTATASPSGAGIKAAQVIVDNKDSKEDVVVTPRCGKNAADVILAADMKLYKSIEGTLEDNVKAFTEGKLSLLEEIHAGHHNHGGK